jgi:hypothetical protein
MSPHEPFVRSVRIRPGEGYPFTIPALAALEELPLDPRVTFLAGENGSGKSTLAEAIALAAGFGPEGGSQNYGVSGGDARPRRPPTAHRVLPARGELLQRRDDRRLVRRPGAGRVRRALAARAVARRVVPRPRRQPLRPERLLRPRRAGGGAVGARLPRADRADARPRRGGLAVRRGDPLADPARLPRRDDLPPRRRRDRGRPVRRDRRRAAHTRVPRVAGSGSCATCSPTSLPACSGFARPR